MKYLKHKITGVVSQIDETEFFKYPQHGKKSDYVEVDMFAYDDYNYKKSDSYKLKLANGRIISLGNDLKSQVQKVAELTDKLHRRNMQIKQLKKDLVMQDNTIGFLKTELEKIKNLPLVRDTKYNR